MMTRELMEKALRTARGFDQKRVVRLMSQPGGARRPLPGERASWCRLCRRLEGLGLKVTAIGDEYYRIEESGQ